MNKKLDIDPERVEALLACIQVYGMAEWAEGVASVTQGRGRGHEAAMVNTQHHLKNVIRRLKEAGIE